MNPRTYKLITASCLTYVVVSAFVFDAAGRLHELIGGSAILAAAIAAGTCFYNQRTIRKRQTEAVELYADSPGKIADPPDETPEALWTLPTTAEMRTMTAEALLLFDLCASWNVPRQLDAIKISEMLEKVNLAESRKRYEVQCAGEEPLTIKQLRPISELCRRAEVISPQFKVFWPATSENLPPYSLTAPEAKSEPGVGMIHFENLNALGGRKRDDIQWGGEQPLTIKQPRSELRLKYLPKEGRIVDSSTTADIEPKLPGGEPIVGE